MIFCVSFSFRKLYAAFEPFSDLAVEPELGSQIPTITTQSCDVTRTTKESTKTNGLNKEDHPTWPFRSSKTNYEIAEKENSSSPVQEYVATAFGDAIPKMENDLIERKHQGKGFFMRHYHAWRKPANWKVDPKNDVKEQDSAHVNQNDDGAI